MQQKSSPNHQSANLDLINNNQALNQSLGELDSLLLEKAFSSSDFSQVTYPAILSKIELKNALYIAEIDNQFYFLDYSLADSLPEPQPIKENIVSNAQALTRSDSESNLDLAKKSNTTINFISFIQQKGLLIGLGLGVFLTLGATRLLSDPNTSNQSTPESIPSAISTAPAQAITTTEVATSKIENTLDASGSVSAYEQIPVMSQASGLQIKEILVDTGDFVERGQVLARLDRKTLTAQKIEAEAAVAGQQSALDELQAGTRIEELAQAEARVANAKSALVQAESDLELVQKRVERNRLLEAEGAITRDRFDEVLNQEKVAQSNLNGTQANLNEAEQALIQLQAGSRRQTIAQAEAQLVQAQGRLQAIEAQLEDTTIVAPASGIIAERQAKVGQIATTSETLFSIIENGRLELRVQIPETLISQIQVGQKVRITSNANPQLKLIGEIREIEPIVDAASRQALVKVDLPSNINLKPGMFLQAAINTDTSQGLAVPIESLSPQSGNKAIAFIVQKDNTVKAQTVTMGEIIDSERVEVIAGLNPGDRLVLKGAAYLKDGDTVQISDEQ